MPELLNLETPDWKLIVWSKDICQSQKLLSHTLNARHKELPVTCLRFNPILHITDLDSRENEYILPGAPVFFENKLYEFDFQFQVDRLVTEPVIKHRLTSIEDAFHQSGNSLRGSINFGNDVGWFKLILHYQLNGKEFVQAISFEVLPTKMDIATDLSAIQQVIDQHYPLLRFSFAQKTEQELARSRKPHERFPLLWLSQFESLRLELEKGVKQILQSPHSRLLPRTRKLRAEQLKGRLSPRLEEQVKSAVTNNNSNKRYKLDSKILSVDTPENRFIKMVLTRCTRELSTFIMRVKENDAAPENSRLSDSFFKELNHWKTPLDRYLKRPFFREIGHYEGSNGESLVLHQKTGYANVYRVWQQLKLYLDVFGQHASISMKSIAELYEVWCVLELRRLLVDELGFNEVTKRKPALYKKGVEKALHDGFGVAFQLQRKRITIRLAHEPLFKKPANQPESGRIYSWITSQKPDILLEAEFENGEKLRWIFDAKYRISPDENEIDLAPDDAINQMHRYRDALIHIHQAEDGWHDKTRPVFGAFVLYPGWFKSEMQNPYQEAISEIGIGAFPLLPNSNNSWLNDFLVEQFGHVDNKVSDYKTRSTDHFYVQEAARISYTGMELSRYKDLSLAVALGSKRSKVYLEEFRQGKAKWYHLPEQTTVTKRVQRAAMREIKSCAFVVYFPDDEQRRIEYIYKVISVQLVKRKTISEEQAGAKAQAINLEKNYWLFELGDTKKISLSIDVSGVRDFKFKLVNVEDLTNAKEWSDLANHYTFLQLP